ACIGCSSPFSASPSIVVTCAPSQAIASVVQLFTALPSIWTTQAPHWLVSQPTCVPVSRRFSRRNCTSNVRPSTSPETDLPFTVSVTLGIEFLPGPTPRPLLRPRRNADLQSGTVKNSGQGEIRAEGRA